MSKRPPLSVLASATRKFSYVLLVLALLLLILVIAQKAVNPFKVVASNSMWPQIKEGDAIILKDVEPRNLKPGDVIVFTDPNIRDQLVIHRVVKVHVGKYNTVLTTKGDNNPEGDVTKVTAGQVVGGVDLNIPGFGSFLDFLTKPRGYIACIAIPGAVALALVILLGVGETAEKNSRKQ